ncbi:MAG: hypothetical protein ACK55Z_14910 [bacterium]
MKEHAKIMINATVMNKMQTIMHGFVILPFSDFHLVCCGVGEESGEEGKGEKEQEGTHCSFSLKGK